MAPRPPVQKTTLLNFVHSGRGPLGIHSAADIRRLRDAGFDAFLVGEHLMQSAKPSEALRLLMSGS